MSNQTRVHAGVPSGGQFATAVRTESEVTLTQPPAADADGFLREWPKISESDRVRGTVRTKNGGEVNGVLSTLGTSYAIDVRTDDGRCVPIMSWRVAGVRLDASYFAGPGGTTTAAAMMGSLTPVDGTDWESLRAEYEEEHPVVMAALRDDLMRHGMKTPVVVRDGKVENGQHRVLAAADVGLPVRWQQWTGTEPKVYWNPETREHYGPEDDEDGEGQLRY